MPSVKLHADKFEQMIARRGRDVEWKEAVQCSCWRMNSGQPNARCKACGGLGFTYEAPVVERALVMSITQNKDFEEMAGVFEVGDAVMTVPKRSFKEVQAPHNASGVTTLVYDHDNLMFTVGMYDLITLLDDEVRTSELLVKGEDIYSRPPDTLLNSRVTRLLRIRISNEETGQVDTYEPGVDVEVDDTGRIRWLLPSAPPDGTQYSVTYMHRPVYTVTATLPKPRHQDGQDLPRYVALRYRSGAFEVRK